MRSATHPNVRTDEHLGRVTQVIAGARDPLQRAQGGSNVGSLEARALEEWRARLCCRRAGSGAGGPALVL